MAKIKLQASHLQQLLDSVQEPIVQAEFVDCPYTTVQNRAQMLDLENDLKVRGPVDRFLIQDMIELPDETGPQGQPVFKPVNDFENTVRLYGNISRRTNDFGAYIVTRKTGDAIEITFYGTGLNGLFIRDNNVRNVQLYIDNVIQPDPYIFATTMTEELNALNYSNYTVGKLAEGLPLGVHTVRLVDDQTGIINLYGYEVIKDSSDLLVTKGSILNKGTKATLQTSETVSYSSDFDGDSDTYDSSVGARVKVYQNSDGTIGKSLRTVDATPAYYPSATHTNEEVIRTFYPREFGCGFGSDYTELQQSLIDSLFVLDDNLNCLLGKNNRFLGGNISEPEGIALDSAGTYNLTQVFVGTGLDIEVLTSASGGDTYDMYIDGVSIGTLAPAAGTLKVRYKIASGLPFGTHTFFIQKTASPQDSLFYSFHVYGPKEPEMPEEAVALSEYYLVADYAATSAALDARTISQGTIFHSPERECAYEYNSGGWAGGIGTDFTKFHSKFLESNTGGDVVNGYFYGTGVELVASCATATVPTTIEIDGALHTDTVNTVAKGSTTWTGGTSRWDITGTAGGRLQITNLTEGYHSFTITRGGTGVNLRFGGYYAITPIFFPKLNGPYMVKNTLTIGNCSVDDLRKWSPKEIDVGQQLAKADLVDNTSTGTEFKPVNQMYLPIYLEEESEVEIDWSGIMSHSSVGNNLARYVFVDGIQIKYLYNHSMVANYQHNTTIFDKVKLSKGYHLIYIMIASGGSTVNAVNYGYLSVKVNK